MYVFELYYLTPARFPKPCRCDLKIPTRSKKTLQDNKIPVINDYLN
jgi:hypothetical protein